jgi:hypothetical protein
MMRLIFDIRWISELSRQVADLPRISMAEPYCWGFVPNDSQTSLDNTA